MNHLLRSYSTKTSIRDDVHNSMYNGAFNYWKSREEYCNNLMRTGVKTQSAQLAVIEARQNMEQVKRDEQESKYGKMLAEIVVGVDYDTVKDPGSIIRRRFNANRLKHATKDSMNKHAETDMDERRKRRTLLYRRRILMAMVFALFLLIWGLFILYKAYTPNSGSQAIDEKWTVSKLCNQSIVDNRGLLLMTRSFADTREQQIRNDLTDRRAEADLEEMRTFLRRILLAIVFALFLLIGGLFILYKGYIPQSAIQAIYEYWRACKLCKQSVTGRIIRMGYPPTLTDDDYDYDFDNEI